MPTLINLRPIQTGDACYLTDHHNRPGECIITVTMCDGCSTAEHAKEAVYDVADFEVLGSVPSDSMLDDDSLLDVANWCAAQWQLAQVDMPAERDRDNEGGDETERYLECHILATWEV